MFIAMYIRFGLPSRCLIGSLAGGKKEQSMGSEYCYVLLDWVYADLIMAIWGSV